MAGDNGKDIGAGITETKKPENLELHIIFKPDGDINVNGCIKNEPMSLWMLDKAKDIIKSYHLQKAAEAQQNKIQSARGIMDFVRGRK